MSRKKLRPDNLSIPKRILGLVELYGMNNLELAEMIGTSRSAVSRFKLGSLTPGKRAASEIDKLYRMPGEEIFRKLEAVRARLHAKSIRIKDTLSVLKINIPREGYPRGIDKILPLESRVAWLEAKVANLELRLMGFSEDEVLEMLRGENIEGEQRYQKKKGS